MKIAVKTFEQWDIDEIERTFGLLRQDTLKELEEWLQANHPPDAALFSILREAKAIITRLAERFA